MLLGLGFEDILELSVCWPYQLLYGEGLSNLQRDRARFYEMPHGVKEKSGLAMLGGPCQSSLPRESPQ